MRVDENALEQFDLLPDSAFVRMPLVCMLNGGVPPQTIYRWIKEGRHPAPVKLGPQVSAFNVGALRTYLSSKLSTAGAR